MSEGLTRNKKASSGNNPSQMAGLIWCYLVYTSLVPDLEPTLIGP